MVIRVSDNNSRFDVATWPGQMTEMPKLASSWVLDDAYRPPSPVVTQFSHIYSYIRGACDRPLARHGPLLSPSLDSTLQLDRSIKQKSNSQCCRYGISSHAWGLGRTLSATAPSRSRKAFDHARPLTKEWAPEDRLVDSEGECGHASTGSTTS